MGKTRWTSATPTSITGKAKAMEMTGLWGQRVALSQGWPWQTLLKPNTATSWHTQLGAVRKVYLTVLGCSKDGLCLCLKVKRRKETRRNFKSDIENENGSMQMVSKLDMPLPFFLGLGACSCLCRATLLSSRPRLNFSSLHLYSRECVKVQVNTTCKSSISQVSLQTHRGPGNLRWPSQGHGPQESLPTTFPK